MVCEKTWRIQFPFFTPMAAVQGGLAMHRGPGFALDLGLGLWKRLHKTPQGGDHGMKTRNRDTEVHLSLNS